MDFHITEEMANERRTHLIDAGDCIDLDPGFVEVEVYEPGSRDAFTQYLADFGIEFFSVDEVVTPRHPGKAREAGHTELVPPMHLWPWTMIVLRVGDELRRAVGRAVRLRNLYRPQSYNELVASSSVRSDHPNACAGDFDFASEDDRRVAEKVVRKLAAGFPQLDISVGFGARTLHVGVMSPKGGRSWFYDSYRDRRVALRLGEGGTAVNDDATDIDDLDLPAPDDKASTSSSSSSSSSASVNPSPTSSSPMRQRPLLDEATKTHIVRATAAFESGGRYDTVNLDGEFEGKFNRGDEHHPAFERFHIGLSYGLVQFTQDSGTLGRVLTEMQRRDGAKFAEVFGPHADALVDLTSAKGPASKAAPPRGPRVQPLDGADLWEEPWVSRFRRAADHQPFCAAQDAMATRIYFDPMVRFAGWLGMDTDRALAMVFDRAVQMGRGGARRWLMDVVGPITDDTVLQRVLAENGFATLLDFQLTIEGLEPDGDFGPYTHAAMCFHERQRSDGASPTMTLASCEEMLEMLVSASAHRRWGHRMRKLSEDDGFADIALDLLGAL